MKLSIYNKLFSEKFKYTEISALCRQWELYNIRTSFVCKSKVQKRMQCK